MGAKHGGRGLEFIGVSAFAEVKNFVLHTYLISRND